MARSDHETFNQVCAGRIYEKFRIFCDDQPKIVNPQSPDILDEVQTSLAADKDGGRDRDRTCDPFGVNEVLSR
jgi:hypothetical protein